MLEKPIERQMGKFKEVCGSQHANKYQTCELERRAAAPYWGWRGKEGKSAAGRMAGWRVDTQGPLCREAWGKLRQCLGRGEGSGSGHQPETGIEEMTKTEPCCVVAHLSKEPKNWGPKEERETGRGRERKKVLPSRGGCERTGFS